MSTKYVIAVVAEEKAGKTCTINNVWDMLPCYESREKVNLAPNRPHEIWGYVKACDSSRLIERSACIGVASRGDEPNQIDEWVKPLMTANPVCDIIICACHHKDQDGTFERVVALCNEHGYTLITCSNFCDYNGSRTALKWKLADGGSSTVELNSVNLNRLSARAIVDLIEHLIH